MAFVGQLNIKRVGRAVKAEGGWWLLPGENGGVWILGGKPWGELTAVRQEVLAMPKAEQGAWPRRGSQGSLWIPCLELVNVPQQDGAAAKANVLYQHLAAPGQPAGGL